MMELMPHRRRRRHDGRGGRAAGTGFGGSGGGGRYAAVVDMQRLADMRRVDSDLSGERCTLRCGYLTK